MDPEPAQQSQQCPGRNAFLTRKFRFSSSTYSKYIVCSGRFGLNSQLGLLRMWGGTRYLRQNIQTVTWGLRLRTFLFLWIMMEGQDCRFNNVRDSPGLFFVYWTLQAAWVFVTLLPTLMLNLEWRDEPSGMRDYIGWGIWALGFATEAIADQQKWNFKKDPDYAGMFIQHGLQ